MSKVKSDGGSLTIGSRGLFAPESEDQITVVLFNNWALFPNCDWASEFLRATGASINGSIEKVRWSFGFEEHLTNQSKRPIADIVLKWTDDDGPGVLVIEAKKRGNFKLSPKDIPSTSDYLQMPSIRIYKRKSMCLLIDEADAIVVGNQIAANDPVVTWQQLAELQIRFTTELDVPNSIREFTVGSLLNTYARFNIYPTSLPYEYLEFEPSALEISERRIQTTADRQIPYWEF